MMLQHSMYAQACFQLQECSWQVFGTPLWHLDLARCTSASCSLRSWTSQAAAASVASVASSTLACRLLSSCCSQVLHGHSKV